MPSSNQPTPPGSRPPSRPSRGGSQEPESSGNAGRMVLYLLFIAAVLMLLYRPLFGSRTAKTLKFSEFQTGLADGTYNNINVFELEIGTDAVRFQDQPAPKPEQLLNGKAGQESASSGNAGQVADTQNGDGGANASTADGGASGDLAEQAKATTPDPRYYRIPIASISGEEQHALTDLLVQKGIPFAYADPPTEWAWLFMFLMFAPFMLLIIMMIRRATNGAGSALAFGRSRGKLYAQDGVGVTFDDVAGIDEAVEELKEVVDFLKSPEKYQALGGRIPKGVLLVGPPGTGKTLLAKAVAGEAGVPFVSLSGSDFVEMFVGVGAARVRDMFQQAAQCSPCIIFIDELDALGKARSAGIPGGHDEREQTLNALLVEMDGFGSDKSIIVMAATNRIDVLDPALLRPGRFDRHVMVDRPDIKGRERILKVHIKRIKVDESVDLQRVAKLTMGFVGADLENLVNEAALLAARKNLKCVSMNEFEEGFERVIAGLEKQSRVLDEEERQRTAYHECGHALVACSLPNADPVHKISIIPRGMALGYTMHRPDSERHNRTHSELINNICCLLGGIGAERLVYDETSVGAQNDLQRATDIARRMVTEWGMSPKLGTVYYSERRTNPFLGVSTSGDSAYSEATMREIDLEVRRILDESYESCLEILTSRRDTLEQMTKELLEVEVMDADHLKRILDDNHPGPQIKPGTQPRPATIGDDVGQNAASDDEDAAGAVSEAR